MRVLVTGSQGFIAKNLLVHLRELDGLEVETFSRADGHSALAFKVQRADFIFHLAGVNRPENPQDYYDGNTELTQNLTKILIEREKKTPLLMTSSIQAGMDNDYGKSKRGGEEALEFYAKETGASVYIYRLPNVFGKWSRPNYNTVIATWCDRLVNDLDVRVDDENTVLRLVYIDDVVRCFMKHLGEEREVASSNYYDATPVYQKSLGEVLELLRMFKRSRESLLVSRVAQGFERALYATYLSFLPTDQFAYALKGFEDKRGTFYEFLKTQDSGQFSISTTAPGVTRGNHYHHTKNEKFLVVKGEASIKHRQVNGDEVIEYNVSDRKMEVVEMIPGYTHDITNVGDSEMVLLIWANEAFSPETPDTYFLEV